MSRVLGVVSDSFMIMHWHCISFRQTITVRRQSCLLDALSSINSNWTKWGKVRSDQVVIRSEVMFTQCPFYFCDAAVKRIRNIKLGQVRLSTAVEI